MLIWARGRSGLRISDLAKKSGLSNLAKWEADEAQPTFKQLEAFAQATHTPIGFFFLPEPPQERLPIPDYRTFGDRPVPRPTPDLLDTIYACEMRQDWFRRYAEVQRAEPVPLVGSISRDMAVNEAAAVLRGQLGFGLARRSAFPDWSRALSGLVEHAEAAGLLVMINGVVGANTHRVLNPQEFRGFTLIDDLAPVIFINGADTKAAQIFTLAHELAHVALGESAVSRPDMANFDSDSDHERWCNEVAAELLVPEASLREEYRAGGDLTTKLDTLARFYKASTLVVLRRIYDLGLMSDEEFKAAYPAELDRVLELAARSGSGGNFYNTQPVRISRRLARAVIADTLEGRTSYGDAFQLLGSRKISAFEELSHKLGVA